MRKIFVALAVLATVVVPAGQASATPPADVTFVVETGFGEDPAPFSASGDAVDQGLICAGGTVVNATGRGTGFTRLGLNFHGIKHFTCADGTGEFFVNLQARIEFGRDVTFNWNVLSGTGDYADLRGAGRGIGIPGEPCGDPGACVLDVYLGGLHTD